MRLRFFSLLLCPSVLAARTGWVSSERVGAHISVDRFPSDVHEMFTHTPPNTRLKDPKWKE